LPVKMTVPLEWVNAPLLVQLPPTVSVLPPPGAIRVPEVIVRFPATVILVLAGCANVSELVGSSMTKLSKEVKGKV